VLELILEKLPVSISLGVIAFLVTYLVCIPLGIMRAVRNGTGFDKLTGLLVLIGHAIPSFTLGVLVIVLFGGGSFWHFFPTRGLVSDHFAELSILGKLKDYALHLFLPAFCISTGSLAFMSSLTKNSILDQMKLEYVRMARLKGLPERLVIGKHILRNAAIPLVTGFGPHFLRLFFTSSLLIESLFSLDGMGLLSYESILHRDYPVVMANFFILSLLFVVGNLISDLLYRYMDPRISFFEHRSR
jgi:microcin C transport system permease protein